MKQCQWCNDQFTTKISYQIYCSVQCRDEAAREKIAERYEISRRQKRAGKIRNCKACGNRLSIYNDETLCDQCLINPHDVTKALKEIKGIANGKPFEDEL
jgi:RecJ-like exonuclease